MRFLSLRKGKDVMNSNEIQNVLPHRYPFLLVDRVLETTETSIKALKNVSVNENIFTGHFPEKHVYPGVLIVESLAQAGAILLLSLEANKGKIAYLVGIDNFKFRKQVIPGDTINLEVTLVKIKGMVGVADCIATVDGAMCAKGTIKFAIND